MPYPTAQLSSDVFEDATDEYGYTPEPTIASLSTSVPFSSRTGTSTSEFLERLVTDGRFDDAARVRDELLALGVPIPPSRAYESAAAHVLAAPPYPGRVSALVAWLRLFRFAHETPVKRRFASLIHLLLSSRTSGKPDLRMVQAFASTLAEKGYASQIAPPTLSVIFRYSQPAESHTFLVHFIGSAQSYSREHIVDELARADKDRSQLASWYTIAIRAQTIAHRLSAAHSLLEHARQNDILINDFTVQLLASKSASVLQKPASQSGKRVIRPITLGSIRQMARVMRVMKKPFPKPFESATPSVRDLAALMAACEEHGRWRALARLRDRLFSQGRHAVNFWILAELLKHTRAREPAMVIAVARHRLFDVGFPSLFSNGEALPAANDYVDELARRYPFQDPLVDRRVSPDEHHSCLVWRAHVALVLRFPSNVALKHIETLYAALLQFVAGKNTQTALPSDCDLSSSGTATAPIQQLDRYKPEADDGQPPDLLLPPVNSPYAPHFWPFIAAFGRLDEPERAAQVMDDMHLAGISPGAYEYGALIIAYARGGHAKHVWALLDWLESGRTASETAHDTSTASDGEPEAPNDGTMDEKSHRPPPPNAIMFASALRGFVRHGLHEDAREAARRMRECSDLDEKGVQTLEWFAAEERRLEWQEQARMKRTQRGSPHMY